MDKEIILKIEKVFDTDQEAIQKFKRKEISLEELNQINSKNTDFIVNIIKKFGFPFKNKVSQKAYTASFLTVQHSGNIDLMEKVTAMLKEGNTEEVDKKDVAYLIDRVRILKNMPQVYGTQYKVSEERIEFFPIEDEENVDRRRQEFGLESLEEYRLKVKSSLN